MTHRRSQIPWTKNACKSVNHILKQRMQWRINQLPDLLEKCSMHIDVQYKKANQALLASRDFHLHPAYAKHRQMLGRWQVLLDRQ